MKKSNFFNNNLKEIIIEELKKLFLISIYFIVIFLIVFYKENIVNSFLFSVKLIYLFLIPGYAISMLLNKSFFERIISGLVMGIATTGIICYFLGLVEINVNYLSYFIPWLIVVFVVLYLGYKKKIYK